MPSVLLISTLGIFREHVVESIIYCGNKLQASPTEMKVLIVPR